MDAKTIVILILIGYLIFWYYNPEDGRTYIDASINKIRGTIDNFNDGDSQCPNTYEPVCAEGTTFDNECFAQEAGHGSYITGEC